MQDNVGNPQYLIYYRAMQPDEKADLTLFGAASRRRVSSEVGCTTAQVRTYTLVLSPADWSICCMPCFNFICPLKGAICYSCLQVYKPHAG